MEMYATPQPLSAYLDRKLACDCGREHTCPIDGVSIGENAICDLKSYAKDYSNILLVCDCNIDSFNCFCYIVFIR